MTSSDITCPQAGALAVADAADRRRRPIGMMRGAVVAAVGAVLLMIGAVALWSFMGQTAFPPWVVAGAWSTVAGVAVAGMAITARMQIQTAGNQAGVSEMVRPASSSQPGRAQAAGTVTATSAAPRMTDGTAAQGRTDETAAAMESRTPDTPPLTRFQVATSRGTRIISAAAVEWLEAKGNYARLHTAGEAMLYRMSISRLEQRLEAQRFVRVHRSAIVNVDSIRRIEPLPSGDAVLHLGSGATVRMSRRFARTFHQVTGRDASRSAAAPSDG